MGIIYKFMMVLCECSQTGITSYEYITEGTKRWRVDGVNHLLSFVLCALLKMKGQFPVHEILLTKYIKFYNSPCLLNFVGEAFVWWSDRLLLGILCYAGRKKVYNMD